MDNFFERFTSDPWGVGAVLDPPSDPQAAAGWSFLGSAPPTTGQFDTLFQFLDLKDKWLYAQMASVIEAAGLTPDAGQLDHLLTAIKGVAGPRAEIFTSSGSFVVPDHVTRLKVTVVGGGGGGQASGTSSFTGGCGGAGGAAIRWIDGLVPGTTIPVTVGTAGTGGTGSGTSSAAGAGGTTSFGAYCSATGGGGANQLGGGVGGGGGGEGVGGDINLRGGYGSNGSTSTVAYQGMGGASILGGGVRHSSDGSGTAAYGAGGGGIYGSSSAQGIAGGAGIVIVEY